MDDKRCGACCVYIHTGQQWLSGRAAHPITEGLLVRIPLHPFLLLATTTTPFPSGGVGRLYSGIDTEVG